MSPSSRRPTAAGSISAWTPRTAPDANSARVPLSPLLLFGFDNTSIRHSLEAIALFHSVTENYSGSILITDAQSHILYSNPAAQRIMGYSREELFGQTPALFRSGKTPDTVYHQLAEAVKKREICEMKRANQ